MNVSVLGEIAIDNAIYISEPKRSIKWSITSQVQKIGGSGANIAVTYNIFGSKVDFYTGTSSNPNHNEFCKQLEREGINIFSIAFGSLSEIYDFYFPDEKRTTVAIYPGNVLINSNIIEGLSINHADILHVTPISFETARKAPQQWDAKVKVLSPSAEYLGISQKQFLELIKKYDILTLDIGEALNYTNLSSLEDLKLWFSRIERLITVITMGDLGSIAIQNKNFVECPATHPTKPIIDSMGCGDVFAASFAYNYISSQNIVNALTYASVNAGYKATISGMWPEMLKNKELFNSSNSYHE